MADRAPHAPVFAARSEFDAFLFALVGDDANGRELSVLSALARLDIDPWREAASLAGLPGDVATERLAALFARLPGGVAANLNPATIAGRVIALLPQRPIFAILPRKSAAGPGAPAGGPGFDARAVAVFAILIIFMVGVQWLLGADRPTPPTGVASAPSVPMVAPPPAARALP
jgi:hypothetical protein